MTIANVPNSLECIHPAIAIPVINITKPITKKRERNPNNTSVLPMISTVELGVKSSDAKRRTAPPTVAMSRDDVEEIKALIVHATYLFLFDTVSNWATTAKAKPAKTLLTNII